MSWRLYTEADQEAIIRLQQQLECRVGHPMDLPNLAQRPILISIVKEENGVITNAAYLECGAEFCAMGNYALSAKDWEEAAAMMDRVCQLYRIRIMRSFVPRSVMSTGDRPGPIERLLNKFGFVKEDHSQLVAFSRWVPTGEIRDGANNCS